MVEWDFSDSNPTVRFHGRAGMFSGGGAFRQCVYLFGKNFINKQLRACGEGARVWLQQALVLTAPSTEVEATPERRGTVTRANQKCFLQQTVAKLII